jgi:hypothetical protein
MSLFRNINLCCAALLGAACGSGDHRVALEWQVVALSEPNVAYPGIEGAKICLAAQPDMGCATTDPRGHFTLKDVLPNAEVVLTIEKDGYIPSLKPIRTTDQDNVVSQPIVMLKSTDLPNGLGFDVDTKDSGIIDFFAMVFPQDDPFNPGPLWGVKVELSPKPEIHPVYFGERGVLDPALTATASYDGTFGLGNLSSGRFFNVPPGDYTLSFTPPPGYACYSLTDPLAAWGFPLPMRSAVRVPVRAGYDTTNVGVHCSLAINSP